MMIVLYLKTINHIVEPIRVYRVLKLLAISRNSFILYTQFRHIKNPSFLVIVSIDLDRNLLLISVSLSPTIIVFLLLLENATHDLGIFTNPIAFPYLATKIISILNL